jgi:hypothetical protein
VAALALALAFPTAAAAQTGVAVLGQISDADSDVAVQNAIVTIEGVGSTLTTPEGSFRFRGVPTGDYTLRVEAFGYEELSVSLVLAADTTLTLVLDAAPLPLDSIVVEAGTLDFEGRVRDPERDFTVVDAQVLTPGRDPVWTDTHGRFDLDDVPEGVPLQITVRAFGYLPIDTTFVPDDEDRYDFDLRRDAFAEALIGVQVRRLEERAGGRLMTGRGSMDRSEILRYTGSHTASTMMQFNFPQRTLDRISCAFLDERQLDVSASMGGEIADFVLGQTLPEEIERLELLLFQTAVGEVVMLQVYTRSFIMAMSTQGFALRTPTVAATGQCF